MKKIHFIWILSLLSCYSKEELAPDQKLLGYEKPATYQFDEEELLIIDKAIGDGDYGEIQSLIIVKNDNIIFENYYDYSFRSELRSLGVVTQIVTIATLGQIIEDGYILSLDDPIHEYLPTYFTVFDAQPEKKEITIRHLLDNVSGLIWDDKNDLELIKNEADWPAYVLKKDLEAAPGIRLIINNGAFILLSSIMQRALGDIKLEEYIHVNILEPIGIHEYQWEYDQKNNLNGGSGLKMKDLDFVKIGHLFLNYGQVGRLRIINENWAFSMMEKQNAVTEFYSLCYGWRTFSDGFSNYFNLVEGDILFTPVDHGQALFIIPKSQTIIYVYGENYFFSGLGSPTLSLFIRIFDPN